MTVSSPKTRAEADRARRDLVSGEVVAEAALIRFVAAPDGTVIADLSRNLPGRGLWVAARREAVNEAARKNLFSRAAKTKLAPASDLADQVEGQLRRRILQGLGLMRRSGDLVAGFEQVQAAVASGKAAWLVEASDGAEDGRRKLIGAGRRSPKPPRLLGAFTSDELGLALGLDNVIHLAVLAGRGRRGWTTEVEKLAGFSPLLPESWREEP